MGRTAAGERFEWLETWVDAPPEEPSSDVEAQLARRCPKCAWLDAVTEPECFRCGHVFEADVTLERDGERDGETPAPVIVEAARDQVRVHFTDHGDLFTGQNDSPVLYRLRRRVIERGLVPGFDKLMSLAEVNPEIFQHFDHQQDVALRALRDMGGTALLADETGLGKTIEAGLIAKELMLRGLVKSILLVVPASLTEQWREELHEKMELDSRVVKTPSDLVEAPNICITTYATLRGKSVGERLRTRAWDMLICDEAHYLKNRATKQYKAVNRIAKKYCLLLSATPFHNKLIELKNLLDLLKPGLLGSTRAFNKQYVDSQDKRKPINVHHLKTILDEVMIRNRRSKVLVTLPPRRACIFHLQLSEAERQFYDDVTNFIGDEVRHLLGAHKVTHNRRPGKLAGHRYAGRRGGRAYSHVLALISLQRELCSSPMAAGKTLRRMSNDSDHPLEVRTELARLADDADAITEPRKAKALFEILDKFPGKLIVFCEYLATMDDLKKRLDADGIENIHFSGRLDSKGKKAALDRFRASARVMLASRTGGEGLNIQFCSNMVNYDLPWNPMAVEQRIGRLHRLGQENEVCVINLSVKDTIEARVLELLSHKIKLFTSVIGEIDLILGDADEDKGFEQLLRDSWIKARVEGGEAVQFEQLGHKLDEARKQFEDIKQSETFLDRLS